MLDEWTAALAADLGLDADALAALDVDLLLDVAKEVAQSVTRPAAPVTTFLVGYAAARAGGSAIDVMAPPTPHAPRVSVAGSGRVGVRPASTSSVLPGVRTAPR